MHRRQQSNEGNTKKLMDLVKRLEDGLFKTASSKVCYLPFSMHLISCIKFMEVFIFSS